MGEVGMGEVGMDEVGMGEVGEREVGARWREQWEVGRYGRVVVVEAHVCKDRDQHKRLEVAALADEDRGAPRLIGRP